MGLFDMVRGLFGAKKADDRRTGGRSAVKRGTQILIIDDSTTVVTMLRRMLEQNGYEPVEAFDAESGIQLARQHLPRLIFLDIVLPGMNGFAALRTLRRDPLTAEIPVIMMSGNEQATEQFWAQKIGADDFMKKPFSRSEVFVRIDKVLGKRAAVE
jgi:twitching motility two-component system response regulator PilH